MDRSLDTVQENQEEVTLQDNLENRSETVHTTAEDEKLSGMCRTKIGYHNRVFKEVCYSYLW